jgi:ATP-binding cassette subfamily C protein CydC
MRTVGRLIKLMAPFRWWVLLAVLLSFATVGASVGLMAVSAYLISKAALATEVSQLTLAVTGVRVFAISRAAFRYAERHVTHTATFRILTHLRVWFYEAIEPLAPARLLEHRSGDLLARIMADLETLENFYVRVIVPPLSAVLVILLGSLLLGSFDIWLGIVTAGFLLLTGIILPLVTQWLSRLPAAEAIGVRAELNAVLVDEVLGMADLQSFGQAYTYQERVVELSEALNQSQEHLAVVRGLANGLTALFTGLAGLTVLWLAIPMVTGGEIDGLLLALIPLTAIACFEAVAPLSQSLQVLESSKAAGNRLFELIDSPPAVVDPGRPAPSATSFDVTVNDLSFSYDPDEPLVLNDLSFSMPSGGRAALIGASGSGKTTLINLLLRFWDYTDGHIALGGQELHDYRAEDVRQLIGLVPQHPYLFNSTIRDNLLLAKPDADDEDLVQACQIAQIHEFIDDLPRGYFTRVGDDGLTLSGGERQRLAIARAVLKNAPILILDEATSHLDALTKERVMEELESFMEGRTTLVVSHQIGAAPFDQIVRLDGN